MPLILLLFQFLRSQGLSGNYVTGAWLTGIVIMIIGFVSVIYSKETFGRDLEFVEK
ncbi:MAG TPA: hypothetical protein VLJ68_09965 [Chitinophagaceae bacterium]|nr:hypothetical protein [Chitinophagaceae bacterium]